ncbi:anthranilate synthase component II [Halorhabdus amylolytica]|uniref:anthranilate synthase component II n=1 Tax=Halorhabdus amylolytica TaxID=2559573 RepID=UPI0010A99A27|nr:anthranilate synthase component II [Halorhabdus amylolytica]
MSESISAGTTETVTGELDVLFVDNFDSFTYNLVEYTEVALSATSSHAESVDSADVSEHASTTVVKNTASLSDVRAADPDAIIISPGPGHPKNDRDVGVTTDVLREISPGVPTLGVCLGLEAAVYTYGGTVGHAPEPIHGKAASISHDGEGVFDGLDQGFQGGRYHSLVASDVPDCFEVTATTEADDGTALVMGIRHREHPIEAVQFHPESVLTAVGHDVIRNFLSGV